MVLTRDVIPSFNLSTVTKLYSYGMVILFRCKIVLLLAFVTTYGGRGEAVGCFGAGLALIHKVLLYTAYVSLVVKTLILLFH